MQARVCAAFVLLYAQAASTGSGVDRPLVSHSSAAAFVRPLLLPLRRNERHAAVASGRPAEGSLIAGRGISSQQPRLRASQLNLFGPLMETGYKQRLRTLYKAPPQIEAGNLVVDDVHSIHYRIYGNAEADKTALFLHGGPGAGCFPNHARFFDPKRWRIVLFDQRGCGSSQPKGCEVNNDTPHLISDIERLRSKIDGSTHGPLPAWDVVLGGSWGVTLALAYAQSHPDHVKGIILRGVCTMRAKVGPSPGLCHATMRGSSIC